MGAASYHPFQANLGIVFLEFIIPILYTVCVYIYIPRYHKIFPFFMIKNPVLLPSANQLHGWGKKKKQFSSMILPLKTSIMNPFLLMLLPNWACELLLKSVQLRPQGNSKICTKNWWENNTYAWNKNKGGRCSLTGVKMHFYWLKTSLCHKPWTTVLKKKSPVSTLYGAGLFSSITRCSRSVCTRRKKDLSKWVVWVTAQNLPQV